MKAAELITEAVSEEKGNIAYGFSKVCSLQALYTGQDPDLLCISRLRRDTPIVCAHQPI